MSRENGEIPKQKLRSDSHKSPEQADRNQTVSRFLEEDFISTVSDRSEDQRQVAGERVSLRFLNQSVQATHQKLWEHTGLLTSEATFRKILLLNKNIKTGGKRKRKTACCRKCSQRSNFKRAFEICGPEDLKERLEAEDLATFVDLAYCEDQSEECLLNTCPICGRENSHRFFRNRLGELSEESLETPIGFQVWEKDHEGVFMPVEYIEPLSTVLVLVVDWIKREQIGLHERQVCLQSKFIRDVKSWNYDLDEPHSVGSTNKICDISRTCNLRRSA